MEKRGKMNSLLKNKKGAELQSSTIIIIILGLVVLVLLILYFTGGLKYLFSAIQGKAKIYSGTRSDAIALCEILCETGDNQFCKEDFLFEGDTTRTLCKTLVTCTKVTC